MNMSEEPSIEVKYRVLTQWWKRHCQAFCLWYLSLSTEAQLALLLKFCPDLPLSTFSKEAAGEQLLPTDIILPEFSQEGMLASQGRIFVLFVTRRLSTADQCMNEDIRLLNDLLDRGKLPSFSSGQLEQLNVPFVDPLDPQEQIRTLAPHTPAETRDLVAEHLRIGRLVRAEVWLALQVRRLSIVSLLEALAAEHQRKAAVKPSPSYAALLQGELAQQKAAAEQTETEEVMEEVS